MSKIKKGLEDFKEDPEKWRQDSWDAIDEKKIKPYNFIMRGMSLLLAIVFLIFAFALDLRWLIVAIIYIILFYKFDARKMKEKYGSKE